MCVSLVSQYHLTSVLRSMFLAYVQHASIGSIRFVVFDTKSTMTLVDAFIASRVDNCNTMLAGSPRFITDRLQHVLNAAAWVITGMRKFDSTLSYISWTYVNMFIISSESKFISASSIMLSSTWWSAACVRMTFQVVSACSQPTGISRSFHDNVAASSDANHSLLQLQWSGTCFQTLFRTQRWASTTSDRHKRLTCSRVTCALEAMRNAFYKSTPTTATATAAAAATTSSWPVSVCLSFCPSVTHVYCIQVAKDITVSLSIKIPGEPPLWGVRYTRGGNNLQFSTEITVCLRNSTR